MKIVHILGREYSMAILGATQTPTSVTHLSESLDIPIATCYRRVDELATVGLLEETAADKNSTSGATRYQRTTNAVSIRFAPTPSVFAWACVRGAVGSDASTLAVSTQSKTQTQAHPSPLGSILDTATATEELRSTDSDN